MTRLATLVTLAGLILGAVPTVSAARCPSACKNLLQTQFRACRATCPRHRRGHACRLACSAELKAKRATCRVATNPTPPGCGRAITTTTTTNTTTTLTLVDDCCTWPAPTCGGTCASGRICTV